MALEYFTEAELRALPQMSDEVTYTDARIDVAAAYVVTRFEEFCRISFIPRSHTELKDGSRCNAENRSIILTQRKAIAVSALTQDGVAFTVGELAELKVRGGTVRRYLSGSVTPELWNPGLDNISITYTAGYAAVPGDIKEVALQCTRARLLTTNSDATIDDRRTALNTSEGTFQIVIADGNDRPTGYPEIDAVLVSYRKRQSPLVF